MKIRVFTARSVMIGVGTGVLVSTALRLIGASWGLAILDGLAAGTLALGGSTSWRDGRFTFGGVTATQRRFGVWMLAWVAIGLPMFLVDDVIGKELPSRADELALNLLVGFTGFSAYVLGGIMATLERLDSEDAAADCEDSPGAR